MPRPGAVERGSGLRHGRVFGEDRQRDALPLRRKVLQPLRHDGPHNHQSRRQFEARSHEDVWMNEVSSALNSLACFSREESRRLNSVKKPIVHDMAQAHVLRCVKQWGKPPADLTSRGAYRELQASHGYEGGTCTCGSDGLESTLFERGRDTKTPGTIIGGWS